MSDIPPPPRKRSTRRSKNSELPSPPPDPPKEDFLAYLDSLQSRTVAEDAFDHLEKLYKLMEQMLELREQNAKLHRRVRDLEHLNNLEKMRRELDLNEDCSPDLDKETAFAETILESILADSKKKLRGSVSKKRNRTGSEPEVKVCFGDSGGVKKTKVSKWTKVKAAFKWEKASPTVSDAKSQDSGIGVEVARYLRVPSCDEHGHSPVDSGAAEISTPGSLSTASSAEDFHAHDQRSPCEDFRSSEDEFLANYALHSKEGSQKSKHKTPWAKMKDIIQTRNSFKKKDRLSAHSDDVQVEVEEVCSDNDNVFEDEEKKEVVPPEVVARYQKAMEDEADGRKTSKWIRVKKAFLSHAETDEDEVQRNYKQLQKKLSLEFHEKLNEWERMKQNSPSSSCGFVEDGKESAFIKKMEEWQKIKSQPSVRRPNLAITSGDLPADFRKKLQEWEKIRKNPSGKKKLSEVPRWKSLSGPRSDASPVFDYPPISDDFKKKLEEWKQIKADRFSPKTSPRHSKKQDKEPQWFEKEMGKIEKEKQRLDQKRQKFLEREESLAKMRRQIVGGFKKEVLIHTPSGFHRFEGISRKFTRKLYEWEKAQGIAPESSTFALLNSSLTPPQNSSHKPTDGASTLVRSKSADSIAISALNLACPVMTQQHSSLSLNDVEELEKECMVDSFDEPEALIVEIEDIVEETASPLHTYRTQQPVYQRQELKAMCEGETFAPKIRRSESTRAQNNYNLIEEVFSILRNLMENESEILKLQEVVADASSLIKLKMFDESQKAMASRLLDKVTRLQEANNNVFASFSKETEFKIKHVIEVLELVQDLSSEVYQLTEKLESELAHRSVYDILPELGAASLNPVIETAKDIKKKMLELRRRLSYICAASDLTAPRSGKKTKEKPRLYVKSDSCNTQSQGAIKKRIRYRQKSLQSRVVPDSDDDDDVTPNLHKKLTRTRSVSDEATTIVVDESIVQKVVVPTQSNLLSVGAATKKPPDSPVTIFVKTTRKLFTPLVESGLSRDHEDNSSETEPVTHLPPICASPSSSRKTTKDISPSIRLMVAKYNQKLEDAPGAKSSSGSASPVAWRSPTSERRVRTQTQRYQEELSKSSPIQKSVSDPFVSPDSKSKRLSEERVQKLQKAKEEFLNSPVRRPNEAIKFPVRNRLSQISMDSESSSADSRFGALTKSASAGMINVDADIYKQFEVHGGGYVSLPRDTKKPSGGLLGGKLSNIASKFRKVKMRKGKMNTVSALCRQSLVVDIQHQDTEEAPQDKEGADEESKSTRWTKLFKK